MRNAVYFRNRWLDSKIFQHLKIVIGFKNAHKFEHGTESKPVDFLARVLQIFEFEYFWLGNAFSCFTHCHSLPAVFPGFSCSCLAPLHLRLHFQVYTANINEYYRIIEFLA